MGEHDRVHLGDLSASESYDVRLAFTDPTDPAFFAERSQELVSVADEVVANSMTEEAARMREKWGRTPYGSPLYAWQLLKDKTQTVLYIGKTFRMRIQDRQALHEKVFKILCRYVNEPSASVFFRMCTVFDIDHGTKRIALEHLPPEQAEQVLADVEAALIHRHQPEFNSDFRKKPRAYWKPFRVVVSRWREESPSDDPLLGTVP